MRKKLLHNDLAAYYQVTSLSDTEICLFLTEIEGLSATVIDNAVIVSIHKDAYCFNPLVDNDQFLELFIKHDVERTYQPNKCAGWAYHVKNGANPIHVFESQIFNPDSEPSAVMKKAACLSILLNKSDRFTLS